MEKATPVQGAGDSGKQNVDLEVEETTERPVMSCYALDLDVEETTERPVMSCYALDLDPE